MNNESGFTLIEIIVSLVILGLVVSTIGVLMIAGVRAYVITRENVSASQKAQLAMTRISRELTELTDIDTVDSGGNCIRYRLDTVSSNFRAIGFNSGNIELKILPGTDCDCSCNGNILTDQVSGFSLLYEDDTGAPLSSTPPAEIGSLAAIHVAFTLNMSASETAKSFEMRINPRNNGNLNGPGVSL